MVRAAILMLVVQMVAASSMLPPTRPPVPLDPLILAEAAASDALAVLGSYVRFCQNSAQPQYYVDCLSERFGFAASQMDPYSPATAALRQALQAAARDLGAVATRYHTAEAGETTPRSATITLTRPLRAIAPQNRAAARAAGTSALDAAQLVLLRSADRDSTQSLAFRQVAQIIGTAKVLLRAA